MNTVGATPCDKNMAVAGNESATVVFDETAEEVLGSDEPGHIGGFREIIEFRRRSDLDDSTVTHDCNSIRHGQRLVLIVSHEDESQFEPVLEKLQLHLHFLAQIAVKSTKRFVQEQYGRALDERPGQRDALLLTTGNLGRLAIGQCPQLYHVERIPDAGCQFSPRNAILAQSIGHVFCHGHVRKESVALEHRIDVTSVGRQVGNILAAYLDDARIGILETTDQPQNRGFPRSGRPENGHELSGTDLQRDIADRRDTAIVPGQVFELNVACHLAADLLRVM